jgi:Uma2 family endonuclease
MSVPPPLRRFTPQEYYRLERAAQYKSDYYDGEIFDLSGETARHSLIRGNIHRVIGNRLENTSYSVFDSNLRLAIRANGLRCYPDVSVFCDALKYDPDDDAIETVTNPTVLIEVLSASTEVYERAFKAQTYRRIQSLMAHILVSQDAPLAECYVRSQHGTWSLRDSAGLEASIVLPCLEMELPLREMYVGVEFEPEQPTFRYTHQRTAPCDEKQHM